MKRTFVAVLALLACNSLAHAQDPVVDMDNDWAGPYIGANIGFGRSVGDVDVTNVGPGGFPQGIFDFAGNSFHTGSEGFLGGVQIGYGLRMDEIVLGIEADAQYADFGGRGQDMASPTTGVRSRQELEFLATLRGRLGYTITEGALIYVTGGLAVGEVDLDGHLTIDGFSGDDDWIGSGSATEWGWTAGFGAEFMLDNNIGVKAEYLYVDLGDESFDAPGTFNPTAEIVAFDFDNQFQLVRVGLNWYFH